jgi:hypothetical protein
MKKYPAPVISMVKDGESHQNIDLTLQPREAPMCARHRVATVILLCLAVAGFAACAPAISEPEAQEGTRPQSITSGYPAPTIEEQESGYPGPTATRATVLPTIDPSPTFTPSETPIPAPTAIPTPQVTPIPTVSEIPELASSAQQEALFWIYGWHENTVWRMDSRSLEQAMLLDAQLTLGQSLVSSLELPTPGHSYGRSVVPSPNGERLAIVTAERLVRETGGESFEFYIYIFDIQSGELNHIAEGNRPIWSPDSSHIAFFRRQELWVINLGTAEIAKLINPEEGLSIVNVTWSPDGARLAFMYDRGMERLPAIWFLDLSSEVAPYQLFTFDYPMYGLQFGKDSTLLYFLAVEPAPGDPFNLWSVSLETGEASRLTVGLYVASYEISPDGQWIFFSGYPIYEPNDATRALDLWLLKLSDLALYRLTTDYGVVSVARWLPETGHITAFDQTAQVAVLVISLANLSTQRILLPPDTHFTHPLVFQQ